MVAFAPSLRLGANGVRTIGAWVPIGFGAVRERSRMWTPGLTYFLMQYSLGRNDLSNTNAQSKFELPFSTRSAERHKPPSGSFIAMLRLQSCC